MSELHEKLKAIQDSLNTEGDALHPLQLRIIQNELNNAQQALGAKDTFVSIGDTKFLMWEYTIGSAKQQIRAIATNRGSKSGHGFSKNPKLLQVQAEVITRGVQIQRVFSVEQEQYEDFLFMELVRSQLQIGVDVHVAQNNVTAYLTSQQEYDEENYVIADDTVLYRSYVEGGVSKNSVSFDKEAIQKYIEMHDNLLGHATQFALDDLPRNFQDL